MKICEKLSTVLILMMLVFGSYGAINGKEMGNMPSANYWDKYGGKDAYAASQQQRYDQAQKSGDTNLVGRLEADAARVGYTLTPQQPSVTPQQELTKATGGNGNGGVSLLPNAEDFIENRPFEGGAFGVPGGKGGTSYGDSKIITTEPKYIPTDEVKKEEPKVLSPNYLMNQAMPIYQELNRMWQESAGNVELAPLVASAFTQLMSTIEQAEASIRKQFEDQMGGVDPATQAALSSLKETVGEQRRAMMEDLSRRGMLQSGVWLEMEDRINKGHLTAQQQMLGSRISDLQNQLNQALQNFASSKINATSQYGLEGIRQMESDVQRRQNAMATNLQNAINMAQWGDNQELAWYGAKAPYELIPESERWQEPTAPANSTMAPGIDYGQQLAQAQQAYGSATTQAQKDAAALRGQEIRQAAQAAGMTTQQVDAAAQEWWKKGV